MCIVRETERNPAQFDISETDLERKSSTSTLTLAYPSDIDTPDWLIQLFNYFSEKLQKPRWLSDTLNELEDEYVFEDDSENVFRKYVVVEAFGVTKKQLMALSRLHDQSYPIATMSIPTAGMAKIAIFDFFPSQQSVLRVLDPYATEGDERQIVVKKLATLSFPESLTEGCVTGPTQLLSSSAPAASQRNDYNDLASAALDLLHPASEPAREIKDAPLGLRLLNAYCAAHTDSILRILAKEDLDTSIARWAGGRETSVKIPVGSEKGSWCRLYHELGVIPVYFPRHSVPAAAIHTGPEVLRAVAFTSLISFSRLGKAVCMAGGVTILPPGEKWLDLALSCVGAREPRDEDDSEFSACEIVETFLTGLRSSPVRREEALIHAIDYIFMDWLEESNQHK